MIRGAKFTKTGIVIVLITDMVVGVLTALFGQIHYYIHSAIWATSLNVIALTVK